MTLWFIRLWIIAFVLFWVWLVNSPGWGQTRVVDGDSVHIDGERIRIHGLDCPELRDPGGLQAKLTLEIMLHGKTIQLKRRGKDKYGRTVAKVLADGRDVACQMIRAKVCREYLRYSSGEYEHC